MARKKAEVLEKEEIVVDEINDTVNDESKEKIVYEKEEDTFVALLKLLHC